MRLELKHWQLIWGLAEHGTLNRAARHLNITQSALSHRLAEAERRLGNLLFERDGRILRVTPAGKAMLQTAKQVLPELERAEEDFIRTASEGSHLVRLGIAAYSAYHWVPDFLKSMSVRRQQLQVDIVAAATQNPVRSLLDGSTDLVLSPGVVSNPGIYSEPLFEDELVLVMPPGHPLAGKPHAEARDLVAVDYLTYSRTSEPGFEYERFIKPSGFTPHFIQIVEMTDAIVELVASGLGVSILSRWALTRSIQQGTVATVPLTAQGLPLLWSLLIRERDRERDPVQRLSGEMKQWFKS